MTVGTGYQLTIKTCRATAVPKLKMDLVNRGLRGSNTSLNFLLAMPECYNQKKHKSAKLSRNFIPSVGVGSTSLTSLPVFKEGSIVEFVVLAKF